MFLFEILISFALQVQVAVEYVCYSNSRRRERDGFKYYLALIDDSKIVDN